MSRRTPVAGSARPISTHWLGVLALLFASCSTLATTPEGAASADAIEQELRTIIADELAAATRGEPVDAGSVVDSLTSALTRGVEGVTDPGVVGPVGLGLWLLNALRTRTRRREIELLSKPPPEPAKTPQETT